MSVWPMVPLGEVLRHRKEFIQIDDFDTYKRCRVQLHAQGVVLRDQVPGSEIKTKKQQVCNANEFLVAEIDAKLGGYGIIPAELDEAIVSSHYFLFGIDESKLDRRFLGYFIRTPGFFEQVAAQGSTNYAAIRPSHVLAYTIPLPVLPEQRRVVERIDALASKIVEAKRLRAEADEERQALISSFTNAIFESARERWPVKPLGELAEIRSGVTLGRTIVGPSIRLPYLRVANVQDGHLDLGTIKEVEVKPEEADKWTLKAGDLLLTEGGDWDKLGRGTVWQDEIPGCIHQNHIFRVRVDPKVVRPRFLATMTSSPYGKSYFQSASKQTTNLASINQRQLKAFPVFVPPIEQQDQLTQQVHNLSERLRSIKQAQDEAGREQAAMLPAILDRAFRGEL